MADNRATVAAIYDAFGRGDVAWILDQLADDIEWDIGARPTALPYLQPGRGRAHVATFFQHVAATLEFTRFEPGPFCEGGEQGEVVLVPVWVEGRIASAGDLPLSEEVHDWRFGPDGKVAAFRHVVDVAPHERAWAERAQP